MTVMVKGKTPQRRKKTASGAKGGAAASKAARERRNAARRLRYANDPQYRQAKIDAALARKRKVAARRREARADNGWELIEHAPKNEVVFVWDPAIFLPILAEWDPLYKEWKPLHYQQGYVDPTHWQRIMKAPRRGD